MVDNRSAGFYGIGGGFNFKSGDISGTAANTQDDKMGPGTEYGVLDGENEDNEQEDSKFVDRSAQLRATLNSLAMMNVANVLNEKKKHEKLNNSDEIKNDKDELENDNQEENEELLS